VTKDAAFFSWVASSDNVGVTAYNVFVNGTLVKTVPSNRTELTGLTALTSYAVRLQAVDAAKNRSALSAPFTITTMEGVAPSVPTNLAASAITRTGFTVSWTASTDNVGVTGYQVLRNGVQVATVRNGLTSFVFANLALNETHQIAVRAIDAAGNQSTLTEAISVSTTPVNDLLAPTAPTDAASSNITKTSVRISWTASTDNVAVTAYNIYRNGTYFGTASALTTFFNARNLTANTEHTFTVRAVDAERNLSAPSDDVTVTTLQ
jgi:chitodextrinase